MKGVVAIDDTGSLGKQTKSRYLHPDRKTYIALLLDGNERAHVEQEMGGCVHELRAMTGLSEFHFTDIYSGNGPWRGINIFAAFCEILSHYDYPFLVQTCDPMFFNTNRFAIVGDKIDGLDLNDYEQLALFLLLCRCKWYLLDHQAKYSLPLDFVIDQGLRKPNQQQHTALLGGFASESLLRFQDSSDSLVIQLADFGAFCLNRMQLLAVKDRSAFDETILKLICDVQLNFVDIHTVEIDPDALTTDFYDYIQHMKRAADRNPQTDET